MLAAFVNVYMYLCTDTANFATLILNFTQNAVERNCRNSKSVISDTLCECFRAGGMLCRSPTNRVPSRITATSRAARTPTHCRHGRGAD